VAIASEVRRDDLGSGRRSVGGVVQGGVCGDGMKGRLAARGGVGGRRPAAQQLDVQEMQCVDGLRGGVVARS
jgi:hypothetical protein